jgi:hypothetical protein
VEKLRCLSLYNKNVRLNRPSFRHFIFKELLKNILKFNFSSFSSASLLAALEAETALLEGYHSGIDMRGIHI